ncbi:HPr kinase/phosphorylase [Clostridium acetireducens DSM 10703]|uniref:HPr kinase/phosphorylase n=1 Tax=Clostridium acetireducens DSM 10703 TaxID=1121290 RepID=A0A1E8EXR9_9CLOT|nr:HPr(Ser) kinase/phosphatase [Clostridium acetireducens]OFI05574.1 HPr kinase/phosphorylase [Clostridium acetireducens DSM 10703]
MSVKMNELINDLNLEIINKGDSKINVLSRHINRPGLQFSGYFNYFDKKRVQIVGKAEWSFLNTMNSELRKKRLDKFFQYAVPCIILTRKLKPHKECVESALKYNRWILRTDMVSAEFIKKISKYLDENLAPETRLHGVLVDVYGIGILIIGESGIGKSETALELIKRGHRLVADDAVDIKRIRGRLNGRSPYITSGMLEVRGMGIIDVPALYGLSSVLDTKTIDLIIRLEPWNEDQNYDRLGTDKKAVDILNIAVRKITIPIRPGRNLAVIIEAAAANYRYSLISKENPVDTISKRINEEAKRRAALEDEE